MEREEKEKGRDRRIKVMYKKTQMKTEHRNRLMESRVDGKQKVCSLQRDSDGS